MVLGLVGVPALAAELANPPAIENAGEKGVTLTAALQAYAIEGGAKPVQVLTRAFTVPGSKLLAGPTIRVKPGDTLNISYQNTLSYDPAQGDGIMSNTTPHGFDVLNLHTHGLHVSPQGNSDNVLLNLYPPDTPPDVMAMCRHHMHSDVLCQKGNFQYSFKIPADHPAGTYWYHTHKHGSVALHLGSGLSGALIVEDAKTGIDSLPAVKAAKEKVLLLQEILYDAGGPSPAQVSCKSTYPFSTCVFYPNQPAPEPVKIINQKVSVNGQFNPTITMQAGEAQLWRVVNTTVGNMLPFCLVPAPGTQSGETPALYVLAADGVPLQRPLPAPGSSELPFRLGAPVADLSNAATAPTGVVNNELLFLSPGQRLDLMVKAPAAPGKYLLLQPDPAKAPTIDGLCQPLPDGVAQSSIPDNQLVMTVDVVPTGNVPVNMAVPTQDQLNGLTVPDSLVAAKDVPADPTQGVAFGFTQVTYAPATNGASVVNGRPFTSERAQRILNLDQMDKWSVQSAADTHMFHIHTNPFQITQRGEVRYAFPIWRDTALINCAQGMGGNNCTFPGGLTKPGNNSTSYGEVLQFLSRAVDFTGDMVMHCHNVDHEDNGMMELITIQRTAP
jgi:FtsP/CotA-like multicopper oxidase with cupredoxin domain